LYDIKAVSYSEPFPRLEFLGFILAEDGRKMSKRWKNVVNPDDMVKQFGADAFRLYEMFIGPFESTAPWSTNGLVGTYRFVERVWKLQEKIIDKKTGKEKNSRITKLVHKMMKKVGEDIEAFKFNTAVSSLMIFVNEISKEDFILKEDFKKFLQVLAPFAPHVSEELWFALGEKKSIHTSDWPKFNKNLIKDDEIKIAVQVNGKVRAEMMINIDETEDKVKEKALNLEQVKKHTESKSIRKVIYVKNRLVNIVV
jgi:leucyl-tRNA synthetase